MDVLHFSEVEKLQIYQTVAAVMHLSTLKFKQHKRDEQAEADGKKVKKYRLTCRICKSHGKQKS